MSDILYHYTSMSVLNQILTNIKDDHLTLRATDIRYLNDISEGEIATEILKNELREHEKGLNNSENKNIVKYLTKDKLDFFKRIDWEKTPPFIFSFSKNRDSLPMWSTYADNALGIAIGLDTMRINNLTYDDNFKLEQCDYNQNNIVRYIKRNINKIYQSININHSQVGIISDFEDKLWGEFKESVPVLKHHSFEYENEWRLIFQNSIDLDNIGNHFNSLNFIVKDGLPKPYIEFQIDKSFIKEIVIGPCVDFNLASDSLFRMLKKAGLATTFNEFEYGKTLITKSNCQYRSI